AGYPLICRALQVIRDGRYGQGQGPIFYDRLGCSGTELSIDDCYSITGEQCLHNQDVAIVCSACPSSEDFYFGEFQNISVVNNVQVYHGLCGNGTSEYEFAYTCATDGVWYPRNNSCRHLDITDIRFTDGLGLYDGIVEVLVGDTWGSTCDNEYTLARVVCNAIGATVRSYGPKYSTTPPFLDGLICERFDSGINSCSYNTFASCTYKNYVACEVRPLNITNIRLADGPGENAGKVELFVDGHWGKVCENSFDINDAKVLCSMLGARTTAYLLGNFYGNGSGPALLNYLGCRGTENTTNECSYGAPYYYRRYSWYTHDCYQSDSVSLICTGPNVLQDVRLVDGVGLYDGRIEVLYNGTWGTICRNNYRYQNSVVICRMLGASRQEETTRFGAGSGPIHFENLYCQGSETDLSQCTVDVEHTCSHSLDAEYRRPLNITGVRLADGTSKYDGRVELEENGVWGLVCPQYFDFNDGNTLCQCGPVNEYGTASYSENGTLATITCSYDHYTKDPIVECINGSWSKLGVCDFHGPPLNITSVRLVDGVNEYEGRVEIEVNGTYGTICDSLFDLNDAETICRTINSSWGSIYFFTRSKYGEGAGPIYIQRLFCDSTSNLLEHCIYHSLGVCDHSRDVGIVCSECAQPSVSRWGIGYFTYNDSALYADCSYYKTYLGTLKMTCDQKTKKWITEGECQQYSSPLEIQDMRLANGQSEREGRVEIKVFDTWGTICENGFGLAEANVICHMIGFPPAQAAYGVDAYGQGTGPIFVDDLSCGQFDTHINNCTYVTYDDCTHLQDVAVKCTECDDPRPMNGSINGTVFKFKSVVEVVCEYGYFLQGERLITCQSDATWSARPECRLIDCGDPLPADGYINGTDFTLGTNIEVICDEGYNISGDSIISCQENRSWSDNTTCSIIDCGELYVENADLDNSNSTTFGKISLVSCFDGYLPSGATPVECLASGAWGETPFCDRRNCSDPTPYRGQRNDTKTSYGTVVLITCDDGLNVAGNAVIVCQANGTWSDRPLCDTSDCGPPVKANGQYMGNTTTGSSATVMCDEGHDLLGPSVVFCDVQDCGILSVEDGIVVLNEGTLFGDSAEISCSTGYELNGDARVTCLDGRDWSDYPNCTIIDCGEIDHPTNGALIVPVAFTYGANVSFQCNDGFILSGESFIVCGISGTPIHGPCENVNYCLTPNAYCVNGACSCQTGIYDERTDSCDRMPLFPFDSDEPENVLVSTTCSSAITFTPGIPVFKRMRYSLFVCSSGLISFDRAYNNPVPPKKKKTDELADFSVIAPYFAEIDLRRSESVTFRKTDVLNDYPYSELQLNLMQWQTVPISRSYGNSNQPVAVWIGYSDDGRVSPQSKSFKEDALRMDIKSKSIISTPNNRYLAVDGMLMKPLTIPGDWQTHDALDCIHWYNQHSCCYKRSTSKFVEITPNSGGFHHYHPAFSPQNHYLYDTFMKDKCCTKSEFCDLYYQLHPVGTCYSRSPYRQGNFWGDPHISTLDRYNFTFNGLGEYTLLLIETDYEWFTLQARTQRAVKFDGNLTDATFFSAFAATDRVNASMHVELNSEKNGFVIFGNQIDLTTQYTAAQDNFEFDSSSLSISENNNSLRVTFKESGILIDIGLGVQMLSLSTIVPSRFANNTRGLLGNFDGDPFNDLMFTNGTILNPSSNEREIFHYGQNWALTEDSTEFFYEDGTGHSDFTNASYVPRFLFEIDNITMSLAIEACGETSSPECIFDFAATLNPELALDTGNKKNVVDQDQKEIEEVMPVVEGCGVVNTTVGQTVSCELTLDEDLDIEFLGNETFDAAFDRNRSTITYTQSRNMTSALRYQAVNQGGRTSVEYAISVLLCTGCSGHGYCTTAIRSETRNIYLRNNECTCHTGYDGPNCENDYDGCAGNPCSLGRECTDLSPQEQETQGRGFVCGACPEGYTTTEGVDACLDIDECSTNDTCEQFCLNTEGSFTCLCGNGYRPDSSNDSKCQDINECEEELHNCTHVCNNTYGAFKCDCRAGYELDVTTQLCTKGLWDPCRSTDLDCRNTSGCTLDANDNPTCFCGTGFELNATGKECIDINECERNVCSQECTNFIGGFQCSCIDGYMLEGVSTCTECEDSYWGHKCNNTCDCNDRGTVECSPYRGCVCEPGWSGSACDDDVNECVVEQNICADVLKLCTNAVGSYSCHCIDGFQKDQTGSCIDANECDNPSLNNCSHDCSNTIGSYSCSCRPGYKLMNSLCQVSDPCKTLSNLTCSGYCVVNNNITECRCQHGFVLGEDDQRCFDVDECQGSTTNMCDPVSRCINTEGSYVCECPVGTRLENDGRTCSECDEYHFGRNCLQECNCIKGVCNSTLGCVCDDGWTGPNCDVDEDECDLQAFTCTMPNMHCVNLPGTASCQCLAGYHTDQTSGGCIDFNECLDVLTHDCAQICTNTNGSYECSCRAGFNQNGKQCTAETECNTDQYSTCPQNSTCVVASGDVMCKCPKGYSNTSTHVCADVNECVDNKHNCMQMCSNIDGGYDCLCRSGFYLLSDGVSCGECRPWRYGSNCDSSCSCLKDSSISCNKTSGECECKPGWTGENCAQNIDECSLGTFQLCPNNSQCVDTSGSFVCKCNTGFSKNGYGKCEECQHGRFGAGCGHTCGCYMHHTERCDYVTGHCTCDKGWRGVTCEEDDNECNDTNACPRNSDCVNTMGSFECNCHIGFKKRRALGEECIKCYDFTYGGNCNEVCTCTEEHSTGCDSINGSCFCMQVNKIARHRSIVNILFQYQQSSNFKSKIIRFIYIFLNYCIHYSTSDVNECLTENLSACDKRARCKNTDGSYTCECPAGTNLHDVGRSCIDCEDNYFGYNCSNICDCTHGSCNKTSGCHCNDGWTGPQCNIDVNECDLGLLECEEPNAICNNTKGSADCVCKAGYKRNQTSGQCEDIEECKDDAFNTCGHICSNTPGRYVCSCYDGYRYVSANNTCADVNECATSILNQCDHKCDNNEGGYLCECDQGFSLDAADNKRCIPITECSEEDVTACPAFSVCYRNETELDCRCNNGYAKNSTGFCTDMDECEEERNPCDQQCNNTEGGFICSCERGFKLVHNTQCDECDTFTFGSNCASPCTCEQSNAESCDPVNGTCTCSVGWMGENCTQDLNECEKEIFDCPEHSHCDNTVGSHTCQCNIGYINIQGGSCEMCGAFRYGDSCAEQCPCSSTTAEACDHVSGNCTCKSNWQGTHCDKDVDECSFSGNVCSEKIHSSCSNTAGSFICTCDSGFSDLNGICEDIDECQNSPCDEGVTCENTEGSFRCLCPQGKKLLNETSCQDCNNNTFGNGCNGQCNCTQENSETADQSCDTVTGSCLCNPHWTGRFCEMDVNECVTSGICTEANTGCRNIHGGFLCDCLRGFTINSETGHCEYVLPSTSELPEDEISVNLTLSLGVELAPGTDLAVQTVFDKIAEKVEKSIRKHFSKYISVQFTILINDLSVGSVNVKYTIIFKKNSDAAIDIFKAVMDIGSVTEIEYEGRNVTALSTESYSSDKTCEFYETKLGGCGSGFECINNYTLVVGVAVGLSVFLVTVFVTLTAIVVYNRNRKEHLKNLRGLTHRIICPVLTPTMAPTKGAPNNQNASFV
ncbi:FBN2-like protein, partial [Mya arenaria]